MNTHTCCNKQEVKKGPWAPDEDEKLVNCIAIHGPGKWASVPILAGLQRCGMSCRFRWINYLKSGLKREDFTPHEIAYIIEVQKRIGNRWAQIAKYFPGRTANDVKNFWNTHIKNKPQVQNRIRRKANLISPNFGESVTSIATNQICTTNVPMSLEGLSPTIESHMTTDVANSATTSFGVPEPSWPSFSCGLETSFHIEGLSPTIEPHMATNVANLATTSFEVPSGSCAYDQSSWPSFSSDPEASFHNEPDTIGEGDNSVLTFDHNPTQLHDDILSYSDAEIEAYWKESLILLDQFELNPRAINEQANESAFEVHPSSTNQVQVMNLNNGPFDFSPEINACDNNFGFIDQNRPLHPDYMMSNIEPIMVPFDLSGTSSAISPSSNATPISTLEPPAALEEPFFESLQTMFGLS